MLGLAEEVAEWRKRSQDQISAFADLVEARSTAMLRLAYAVVGDYQLAQDLLQESLVKVYVAWPRPRDGAAVEAYVPAESDGSVFTSFEWIDDATLVVGGPTALEGATADILACHISNGRCEQIVKPPSHDTIRIVPGLSLPG